MAWMRVAFAALICLTACNCSLRLPVEPYPEGPPPATSNPRTDEDGTLEVWMHADRYHTGLVFPYPALVEAGFVAPEGFGMPRRVIMSWGNTDAYSHEGISGPHEWLQVLFTPTPSVLELIPINREVPSVMAGQRLWKGEFPASRGPHLAHFLNQCTRAGGDGRPRIVRPSTWGGGVQLEGNFPYFIPRVCNIWSCQAIESLGGTLSPMGSLTANGLARQLVKPENGFIRVMPGPGKD